MKFLLPLTLVITTSGAIAQTTRPDLPSCDLKKQRTLKGKIGGSIRDAGQAHISERANILQADLGTVRKGRLITQAQTDALYRRIEAVRTATDRFVAQQGFLSAAERASYDRELDAISTRICRR